MSQFSAKVHSDGPDKIVVESGGTLDVQAGATVSIIRAIQRMMNAGMRVGAGAGFTLAGNTGAALCPASQTAATLVIPVSGLKVGDTITGFKLLGQIESAGGAVTVDADLRKLTNAAADPVDASVGAITQVAVTADTAMATEKASLAEVVAENEMFYVLVTVTTAASTDVQILGALLEVTEA